MKARNSTLTTERGRTLSIQKVRPQWLFAHFVVFSIIALPAVAYGADYKLLSPLATPTMAPKTTVSSFSEYAKLAFQIVVGIAGLITVIILIIGGIEYVSSGISGNEAARTSAHKRIWDAITGLILALSGYFILYTINPKLANFELKIPEIKSGAGTSPAPTTPTPTLQGNPNDADLSQYEIPSDPSATTADLTHSEAADLGKLRGAICPNSSCVLVQGNPQPAGVDVNGRPQLARIPLAPTQELMNTILPTTGRDNSQSAWGNTPRNTTPADFVNGQTYMVAGQGYFTYYQATNNFIFEPDSSVQPMD